MKRLVCKNCGAVADPKADAERLMSGVMCKRGGRGKGCYGFSTWKVTCKACGRVVQMYKDETGLHFDKEIKAGAVSERRAQNERKNTRWENRLGLKKLCGG